MKQQQANKRHWTRRGLLLLCGATGLVAISVTTAACSLLSTLTTPATGSTIVGGSGVAPQSDKLIGANAVQASQATRFETIRSLEYSFMFVNEVGSSTNPDPSQPTTSPVNPGGILGLQAASAKTQYSSAFGTGWLFDYKLDSSQQTWTGYFGTNLHVADELMRADDNQPYAYTGANNDEQTIQFYLGKFDNTGNEFDSQKGVTNGQSTYVQISTLPKTQFASINFYKNNNGTIVGTTAATYADFAVIAVTLNLATSRYDQKVYNDWIKPSVRQLQTLAATTSGDRGDASKLFHASALESGDFSTSTAAIAGYPAVTDGQAKFIQTQSGPSFKIDSHGEWTINQPVSQTTQPEGQAFDVQNKSPWKSIQTKGVFNANNSANFKLTYHGVEYQQTGLGAVVNESNLGAGSSGSMALDNNNAWLGIYYGTMDLSDEQGSAGSGKQAPTESDYGVLQLLYVSQKLATQMGTLPYDLISGTTNNNGYKDSLGSTTTWLFN